MRSSLHMRNRARQLRKTSTVSEQRIWNWLRNRTFRGFKFRRQVAIGAYVVDFYCVALKLAIELDGHHHESVWMADYDAKRSLYLSSRHIEIVRITNQLVARDSLMAEQVIEAAIEQRVVELSR